VIRSRRMRWERLAECVVEIRNAYKILVGKAVTTERMILKTNFEIIGYVDMDWIQHYVLRVTKRRVLCARNALSQAHYATSSVLRNSASPSNVRSEIFSVPYLCRLAKERERESCGHWTTAASLLVCLEHSAAAGKWPEVSL
jgi:hypothetical protein